MLRYDWWVITSPTVPPESGVPTDHCRFRTERHRSPVIPLIPSRFRPTQQLIRLRRRDETPMRTLVPFGITDPKTRLASLLDASERRAFARAMLADVVQGLAEAGAAPEVVATAPIECDAPVTVDDRSLDSAMNDALASADGPVAIVMADLALATPAAFEQLFTPDAESCSPLDSAVGPTPSSLVTPGSTSTTMASPSVITAEQRANSPTTSPRSIPSGWRRTWTNQPTSSRCCCTPAAKPLRGCATKGSSSPSKTVASGLGESTTRAVGVV